MKPLKMICLVLLLLPILIMGCNRTESRLVGKWKNVNMPEIVEFRGNKTGVFVVQGSPSLPFTWKVVEDKRVKIDIPYMGRVQSLFGKVTDDAFVLEGKGEQAVYKRAE